jgi:hypothetical protein
MKATYIELLNAMITFKARQVVITYDGGKKNNTPCKLAESVYITPGNELLDAPGFHAFGSRIPTDRIFDCVKSFTFF